MFYYDTHPGKQEIFEVKIFKDPFLILYSICRVVIFPHELKNQVLSASDPKFPCNTNYVNIIFYLDFLEMRV